MVLLEVEVDWSLLATAIESVAECGPLTVQLMQCDQNPDRLWLCTVQDGVIVHQYDLPDRLALIWRPLYAEYDQRPLITLMYHFRTLSDFRTLLETLAQFAGRSLRSRWTVRIV